MQNPLPHELDLWKKPSTAHTLDVLTFCFWSDCGHGTVRDYVDSHQGRTLLSRPYLVKSGVAYGVRYHAGEIQLWEIQRPYPEIVAFIREADHVPGEQ